MINKRIQEYSFCERCFVIIPKFGLRSSSAILVFSLLLMVISWQRTNAQDPIDDISSKYLEWIIGSPSIDYTDPYVSIRYEKLLDKINKVEIESMPIPTDKNSRKKIWEDFLFPLAISYHLEGPTSNPNAGYQSDATRDNIIEVFNVLNENGWNNTIDIEWKDLSTYPDTGIIGLGGTYGNVTAGYAVSVFLCKDLLITEGIYEREMETLDHATAVVGPDYEEPVLWEVGGLNTDMMAGLMLNRMAYVLAMEPGTSRDAEILYFQKMLNKALMIADGFADFIKSDFTTNHHKNAYVSTYGSEGLRGASVLVYMLDKSPYAASVHSISNLSNALLAARIYSNLYDYHQGVSGRASLYDKFVNLVPAFAHVALINSSFSSELKGAFKRYWAPEHPRFESMIDDYKPGKGYINSMGAVEVMSNMAKDNTIEAEAAPQGHWYFNYAGMSVHRRDEWVAIWKGQGKYLWDFEGPVDKAENIYGKYGSAGALIILNEGSPVSREESGMITNGWDWRRIPGTTTLNSSYADMTTTADRNFASNVFVGGISIDESHGMSSIEYRDPLSSLEANKSLFYFENYIVALGSEISASAENDDVQTTLFQTALPSESTITYLNGEQMTGIGQIETITNQAVTSTDAAGNAYYIPYATSFSFERINQTAPDESGKNILSSDYVSARLLHGSKPSNASYEYYIDVNGGDTGATNLQINASELFEVLKHDYDVHIVKYNPNRVTSFALRSVNTETGYFIRQTDTPCIAMVKDVADGHVQISVMNPEVGKLDYAISYHDIKTKEQWHAKPTIQPVRLTISGNWSILSGNGASLISTSETETQIQFDCIDGKGIQIELTGTRAPDVPIAVFSVDMKSVGVGETVSFIDESTKNPVAWLWTFEGGTPSTSIEQNPSVSYKAEGNYAVSLVVTNENGSDEEVKQDYISVQQEIVTSISNNLETNVVVYPNPIASQSQIRTSDGSYILSLEVTDLLGRKLASKSYTPGHKEVNIPFVFPNGPSKIYLINVKTTQSTSTLKVVK